MPYTPPSQRSPASSKPSSPILSRNHSYVNESTLSHPPASVGTQRPALPRSISSTSYLNKHRRSPSINSNNGKQSSTSSQGQGSTRSSVNGSLRQSPPPVNNLLIPTGAITTPPDSASDDEDRGRQLGNLAELQEALQSIQQKRGASPVRNVPATEPQQKPASQPTTPTVRPALTPEARKISHSRSSSEIQLSSLATIETSSSQSSDDSDADDDELRMKPPLVRKKSGELVKPALRPSSSRRRPSSMPGTPTFHKAVHFNDDIEQVRHFLQIDRPIAVSAGSSPVEVYDSESEYPFDPETGYPVQRKMEWELKLANFPRESFERSTQPVRVERIFLSSDNKTLIGTVAVANIAFSKHVVARFTLDYWKTTSEVVAEYNNDVRKKQLNDGYDRFNFNIKLADQANLETKTLLLCVRYSVNGQDYWDNNNNTNYQVDFAKKKPVAKSRQSRSVGAIPRSRHSPNGRQRSFPAGFEDDFSQGIDASKYQFGSKPLGNTIRLKSKNSKAADQSPTFSTRYDFSTSLHHALNTAQSALGNRSGIKVKVPAPSNSTSTVAAPAGSVPEAFSATSTGKPDLKSAEYNELIQKFCFFGTPSVKSPSQTPPKPVTKHDGSDSDYSSGSKNSSGSTTPIPSRNSPLLDGANDHRSTRTSTNHFLTRSTSPGPFTGSDFIERTRSPMNFGYPYNHGVQSGLLGDAHTPQAILS